jgi:2-aminoethylphosphonate-pyruvate transaminase
MSISCTEDWIRDTVYSTYTPADGKLLICVNGAYGHRIARMCEYYNRDYVIQECGEDTLVGPCLLDRTLSKEGVITYIAVVHTETTSGILNPIGEVATVAEKHGRGLLIDAMSSFGTIEINVCDMRFDAVYTSSNKCLEGA